MSSNKIEIYKDSSYIEKNQTWHEEDSEWKYAHIRELIKNITITNAVDVGCGAGKIIELLQHDFPDVECHGFDITDNVQKFWEKRDPRIQFHFKDILTEQVHYDLLLLIDVFEHVEDYYSFLRLLRKKSKYFVFHIPLDMFVLATLTSNYKQKKESVGHLHYFDYNTALGVLEDTGYDIMDYKLTKSYKQANTKLNNKLKALRGIGEVCFGQKFNSKLLGGYSLMVLCK